MWRSLHRRASKGFTLVELLVVILIVGILAGVAVPIYMNQKTRAYRTSAVMDGHATATTISSGLFGLTSFGDANGTITVDASVKPATVTIALGGTGSASSPSVLYAAMTAGTTASGVTYANTTSWCLDIVNNNQHVIYTEAGITTAITSCGSTPGTNGGGVSSVSGGVLSSDATYYYRTFLASGTLVVSGATLTADALIIGGGGSGARSDMGGAGGVFGGGGGAGGIQNPLAQTLAINSYPIVVGLGGIGSATNNTTSNGNGSSVFGFTAGGGLGGDYTTGAGGSTGSSQNYTAAAGTGGTAAGGAGQSNTAGGALGSGGLGTSTYSGWATATSTGVSGMYAGGGGGGHWSATAAPGSAGGGLGAQAGDPGNDATSNTGSGGGGMSGSWAATSPAGSGGSGIVIIRYTKAQVGG